MNDKSEPSMQQLKKEYDERLKEGYLKAGNGFYDDDFPYSPSYPLYMRRKVLDSLISYMGKSAYEAYKNGAGKELDEGENGTPPKFLHVASSSRFCFTSLNVSDAINEKEGADYFSHEGEKIKRVYFEKQLPILEDRAIPPHMDAYAKTSQREYFFECKCHEMFDEHERSLSKRYFGTGKDLIVDHIPSQYLHDEGKEVTIDFACFGLKKETTFDLKQFLTHLMGIVCNKSREQCDFIYLYCLPKKGSVKNESIEKILDSTIEDALTLFESDIVKAYCDEHGISLRLYSYEGVRDYAADGKLVSKIY